MSKNIQYNRYPPNLENSLVGLWMLLDIQNIISINIEKNGFVSVCLFFRQLCETHRKGEKREKGRENVVWE